MGFVCMLMESDEMQKRHIHNYPRKGENTPREKNAIGFLDTIGNRGNSLINN